MTARLQPFAIRLAPFAAILALAACGASDDNAPSTTGSAAADAASSSACGGEDGVAVSEAWARSARAGQPATAAYMTLCSDVGDTLVAARFDGSDATELHLTTVNDDGVASMMRTDKIELPAGEPVALKPRGKHIMMIGITEALPAGETATLTLEFEKAGAVEVTLDVREAMGAGHH